MEIHKRVAGVEQSPITEWYVNREEGLEQSFTVATRLAGGGAGEWLKVMMDVEGNLQGRLVSESRAIEFQAADGASVLRYEKLVMDASGRELVSRMGVGGSRLWLEVEDVDAVYPLVIDPRFTQQAKLMANDAAAHDFFGHSVAIRGRKRRL